MSKYLNYSANYNAHYRKHKTKSVYAMFVTYVPTGDVDVPCSESETIFNKTFNTNKSKP